MKIILKKRKSSAIVVAVLIAAAIGVAALGINALAIRQINISETYNNGLVAFYSAESGIEEGLLRFRFDKNSELPLNLPNINETNNLVDDAYSSDGTTPKMAVRVNMNEPENLTTTTENFYNSKDRKQIYDLRQYFKTNYYGLNYLSESKVNITSDLEQTITDQNYLLKKDNAYDFQLLNAEKPGTGINDATIYFKFTEATNCTSNYQAVEIKAKIANPTPEMRDEYTEVFDTCTSGNTIANSTLKSPDINNKNSKINLKSDLKISSLQVREMTIRPIGGDIVFAFEQKTDGNIKTSGPTTTVSSIGYFAGTSRKINATINRQTGNIQDIFHYVIYDKP